MDVDWERVEQVRGELTSRGLDGLVCQLSSHLLMLTGYAPVLGQSLVVFPVRGDPIVIVPKDEEEFAREGWWSEVRPYESAVLDASRSALDLARPLLHAALDERGLRAATIGYEGSAAMVPASYSQVGFPNAALVADLRAACPDARLVDVGRELSRLQAFKTPREIEGMRRAADIAALLFEGARGAIRDRATEAGVAAGALAAGQSRGRHYGVSRLLPFVHVMSGPRAERAYQAYNLTADRTMYLGDPVLVQVEVYADGFWSEVTRTFFVGNPRAEGARIYETCLEAQALAIDAVRPGVPAASVDRVARDYLAGSGFGTAFRHGTGHGVGFQAISHLQPPRIAPGSPDTLAEGMTFNLEPAVYLHGWGGCRINDTVVVRPDRAEVLTPIPRDLGWAIVPQPK
jgi:Xaa-Pro aminopeptidase